MLQPPLEAAAEIPPSLHTQSRQRTLDASRPDNTAGSWREVAGRLTPEQAAQFELSERSGDDPATLLAMARELAADNMTGVVVLSGEISAPPDAAHIYGWQTYGELAAALLAVADETERLA